MDMSRSPLTMTGWLAPVVGIVTMICAAFGLLYNGQSLTVSLTGGFEDLVREHRMTWFYPVFYSMSGVMFLMRSSGQVKTSSDSTTRSACLPGSSVPSSCSWREA